jgi:hypothetical protein
MVHRHWDDEPEPLISLGLLLLVILLIMASL